MNEAARDPSSGESRVFKIGKRRYAFGLFWQTPSDPNNVTREAKQLALDENFQADLFAERKKPEVQFALGWTSRGLVVGATAAAACAAARVTGSWLGAFRLGTGWWLVTVRDDLVEAEGDRYYEHEADARERFNIELRQGGWQKTFAPEGWGPGTEELSILDILGTEKGPTLQDVNPFGKRLKLILLAGILAGLGIGGAWWYKSVEEQRRDHMAAVNVDTKIKEIVAPPAPPPIPPWHNAAAPGTVFQTCWRAMSALPTAVPGYRPVRISCATGEASASFSRGTGNSGWAEAWGARMLPDGVTLSVTPDGTTATLSVALDKLPARGEEGAHTTTEITRSLVEASNALDNGLALGAPRIPQPPPEQDPQTWTPPPFAPASFSITTALPTEWGRYIATFPGLVVNSVDYDHDQKLWTIQGDVYVRL